MIADGVVLSSGSIEVTGEQICTSEPEPGEPSELCYIYQYDDEGRVLKRAPYINGLHDQGWVGQRSLNCTFSDGDVEAAQDSRLVPVTCS